ncbi:MAG TPA: pilin [Candidatus Faecalibacterium intestinigallinarum]|uniref:Pilin n=1 Tax=Candidatus Faecalibacterium intestinigallinarum TaxID=2838581 RepID=A0A9D1Q8Z4_9FIRM|nr:pilin [Candidatus Faecalibacterium intestinigallinarum]
MTHTFCYKRLCAAFLALVLLVAGGLSAGAAAGGVTATLPVSVTFWEEDSEGYSVVNDGVDDSREATLVRQSNGTYTLQLPIQTASTVVFAGHLSGLTIGDISYDGEVSGSLDDGSAVLTIRNLPSSVLTGSNVSRSLIVTCAIEMDVDLLGETNRTARMCIAVL